MTFLVVASALAFWAFVFAVYFASMGTTPLKLFFGGYEPPPELGIWKEVGAAPEPDLVREDRYLLPEGRAQAGYLLHQVRYRDRLTRAIVRVEPEQRLARRRVGRSSRG